MYFKIVLIYMYLKTFLALDSPLPISSNGDLESVLNQSNPALG